MKALVLAVLLLVSIAFLGCVQPSEDTGGTGTQVQETPELIDDPFSSEEEAFAALEEELNNLDDLSLEELEQALQE